MILSFLAAHPKFHPVLLMTLDVASAGVYALGRDWRRTTYWLAAAVLTGCVTL